MKATILSATIGVLALLLSFTFWSSTALAETKTMNPGDHDSRLNREDEVLNILSALEKKVEDPRLLDRVRVKLSGLPEREFSLIASLSKKILQEGDQPKVDIAFLVITVLIVLS